MGIIPNQSEKRFITRLMKNGKKSIRLNPIYSEANIRMNSNQFETKFLIQINPSSDCSKPNFQSESPQPWIHSDWYWLKIWFGLIQARIDLDWKLGFGLVRIHSDWCLGINRNQSINFWPFFIKRVTKERKRMKKKEGVLEGCLFFLSSFFVGFS